MEKNREKGLGEDFKLRLQKLQATLNVDLLLIDQPVDLYYLTGLDLSKGRLAVGKKGAFLFVDGRYFESARKTAPCEVILSESGAFQQMIKPFERIGFDGSSLSVDGYRALQKELPDKIFSSVPNPLRDLRLIKDETEIALLQKAANVTWKGLRHAVSQLKEGVLEEEIAWEFERYCREHGASNLSFPPIVAFGENSAYPHHRAGKTRLKKDQVVLIDVGAVVHRYAGDLTRVYFFKTADPEMQRRYQLVQRAQKSAIQAVQVGMTIGELDRLVREIFHKEGCDQLFTHSLGHGIGLETHEYPRIRVHNADAQCVIKPNMVFTIEPGLYQPGLGGVRYEDMILVTQKGAINLYPDEY